MATTRPRARAERDLRAGGGQGAARWARQDQAGSAEANTLFLTGSLPVAIRPTLRQGDGGLGPMRLVVGLAVSFPWGYGQATPPRGLNGTRIQPLASAREILPVSGRVSGEGRARPKAVSEFLVDRMVLAGKGRAPEVLWTEPRRNRHRRCGATRGLRPLRRDLPRRDRGLLGRAGAARPAGHDPVPEGCAPGAVRRPHVVPPLPGGAAAVPRPRGDGRGRKGARHRREVARGPDRMDLGAFKMPGQVFHEIHAFWRGSSSRCRPFPRSSATARPRPLGSPSEPGSPTPWRGSGSTRSFIPSRPPRSRPRRRARGSAAPRRTGWASRRDGSGSGTMPSPRGALIRRRASTTRSTRRSGPAYRS